LPDVYQTVPAPKGLTGRGVRSFPKRPRAWPAAPVREGHARPAVARTKQASSSELGDPSAGWGGDPTLLQTRSIRPRHIATNTRIHCLQCPNHAGKALYDLHGRSIAARPGTAMPADEHISWHRREVFKGEPLAA
jgi:hypothetical protein